MMVARPAVVRSKRAGRAVARCGSIFEVKPFNAAARFWNVARCFVVAGVAVCAGLAEQLPTAVFSAPDGLHTTVNRIVVDSKGFVWFPGSEGLARFDGNGFRML